tara:strand:- start:11060 stop:11608 length:549 start_codon:yes stop_codon:yes gene_type:complete
MAHYPGHNTTNVAANLPDVQDPDRAFADILQQDYNDYIGNFQAFEDRLLGMVNDDSLIRRSRRNAERQARIAAGARRRALERYGGAQTPAQQREAARAAQRGEALSLTDVSNNARVQQSQINQALMQEIIGIGQGVNARALEGLGTAAQGASQRRSAYKQAKAGYASQMAGMGASILASFLI